MEIVETGIQIKVAFLETARAFHEFQRRVHVFPDDECLDGGIRVVTGATVHAGEDFTAGMVGEQCLCLQLRPVFPKENRKGTVTSTVIGNTYSVNGDSTSGFMVRSSVA